MFECKSQPLKLSPIGQRLLEAAYDTDRMLQQAERDVCRILAGVTGQLRMAVECHLCFDWLMPQ